jgi:tetratricopeptide (TPR) repeat protein
MTDAAFPDRLTQLRAKWEGDSTSRVFLQLAEEYRHLGRVKEALAVLEKGLKEHPGYLSALVAKGRCHLELGEGEAARAVLERVVKQDATQMVANKLLVRAYLETGEPAKARERLDLYSLLNDSDPEIEELRRRIKALDRPAPAEEPRPMDADPFSLEPPAATPRRGDEIFPLDEIAPPLPVAVPAFAEQAAEEAAEEITEEVEAEPGDLLFPGLASRASRRRYLEGLAAEGLFAFAMPETVEVAAPEPAPVLEPVPEPVPEPAADESAWLEETAVTTSYASGPIEPEEARLFHEPVPAAPVEEDLWAEEPEPEPLPELELEPEPFEREPAATATLGELYLRQGHLDEAGRIFREVLQREPESSVAQAGLARLAELAQQPVAAAPQPREARPLDAEQLLAGFQPTPGQTGGDGVTARKIFLLNSYLKRLRQGSAPDVS